MIWHRMQSQLDMWQLLSTVIATLATRLSTVYFYWQRACVAPTYGFVYILHSQSSTSFLPKLHQNSVRWCPQVWYHLLVHLS